MHAPHIGDIVIVCHPQAKNNGAETCPAVVTQVFDVGPNTILCNLLAFPPFMAPQHLGSVTFYPLTPHIKDELFVGCWPKLEGPRRMLSPTFGMFRDLTQLCGAPGQSVTVSVQRDGGLGQNSAGCADGASYDPKDSES